VCNKKFELHSFNNSIYKINNMLTFILNTIKLILVCNRSIFNENNNRK
jgi:hypothetical protein